MKSISRKVIHVAATVLAISLTAPKAHCLDQDMAAQYKGSIVDAICKDGGMWLKCYKLEPLKCPTLSRGFVDACFDKLVVQRNSPVANEAEVQVVSDNILGCIRSSFKARYGDKREIPECSEVY